MKWNKNWTEIICHSIELLHSFVRILFSKINPICSVFFSFLQIFLGSCHFSYGFVCIVYNCHTHCLWLHTRDSAFEWKMSHVLFDCFSNRLHTFIPTAIPNDDQYLYSSDILLNSRLCVAFLNSFLFRMVECDQFRCMAKFPVRHLVSVRKWCIIFPFEYHKNYWIFFRASSGFKKLTEQMQFHRYIFYGFGFPGLLTFSIYILDQIESFPDYLRPGMGVVGCFRLSIKLPTFHNIFRLLFNKMNFITSDGMFQELFYFYLPAAILLLLNNVLFILSVKGFYHIRSEASKVQESTFQQSGSNFQKTLNKKKDKWALKSIRSQLFLILSHLSLF